MHDLRRSPCGRYDTRRLIFVLLMFKSMLVSVDWTGRDRPFDDFQLYCRCSKKYGSCLEKRRSEEITGSRYASHFSRKSHIMIFFVITDTM